MIIQKLARRHVKRSSEALNQNKRRIAHAALHTADIGAVYPGIERKVFLRLSSGEAQSTDVLSELLTNIHCAGVR